MAHQQNSDGSYSPAAPLGRQAQAAVMRETLTDDGSDERAGVPVGLQPGEAYDMWPGDVWVDTGMRSDVHDAGVQWHARLDADGEVELYEPGGPSFIAAADVRQLGGGFRLVSRHAGDVGGQA